jgi:prephenate dehydrogenase
MLNNFSPDHSLSDRNSQDHSIQDTLQQIDQSLISLLSRRIAVMKTTIATSDSTPVEIDQQLAQNAIPSFVWNSLVTSCAAATRVVAATSSRSQRVVLVGGAGKMGSFIGHELAIAGHRVSNVGRDWRNAANLVYCADLILICVPISEAVTVVQKIAPYLSRNTALADITGVKTPIMSAMLECHPGPVLSLHPMFGPGVSSLLSQNVVICPGRQSEAFNWLLDLLQNRGAHLTYCTPEEHDRMMVTIQAIRLFLTFGLGVFLAEADINLDRSLELTSPPYRLQLNLVSRLFAQDAALPIEMMTSLDERREAIARFASTCGHLAQLVESEDQTGLQRLFESTCQVFQSQMPHAVSESNHMIESLSVLLAAQTHSAQHRENVKA